MTEVEVNITPEPTPEPVILPEPTPEPAPEPEPEPEDVLIQQQLEEVEQWRTNLLETQAAQGQAIQSISEQLAALAGSVGTLLTLAQPQPPPVLESEDVRPVEGEELEPTVAEENPVEPESQPEPPPPPRRTGKAWI